MFRLVERVARGVHRLYLVSQKKSRYQSTPFSVSLFFVIFRSFAHICNETAWLTVADACCRRGNEIRTSSASIGNLGGMTGSTRTRSTSLACCTSRAARGCRYCSWPGTSFRDVTSFRRGERNRTRIRLGRVLVARRLPLTKKARCCQKERKEGRKENHFNSSRSDDKSVIVLARS